MDPVSSIIGPLGQAGVLGSVVIALGYVCWTQRRELRDKAAAHLADVKAYADKYAELLTENTRTQTALANAIDRISERIR